MNASRRLLCVSLASLLFVSGCGGSSTPSSRSNSQQTSAGGPSTASPAPVETRAEPFAIVPLRLRLSDPDAGSHFAELAADGTITVDGRTIGRFDSTRVLDAQGEVALEVTPDGHIAAPGQGPGPELTDDGALVASDSRIVLNTDGTIEERMATGRIRIAPFRFESLPPGSMRTAIVFVSYVAIASDEAQPSRPSSAVDNVASAAPDAGSPSMDAGRANGRRRR